jgi:predicted Zn-dependent protease
MLRSLLCSILIVALVAISPGHAQRRPLRLVRDAEIERTLRIYSQAILRQAGLSGIIKIHIVNDSRINAFVAAGRHMFINTGLLMRSDGPEEVMGVIAHEAGHIAGGHLVRLRSAIREAQIKTLIAALLGAAAGVAARDSRVGAGAISLGTSLVRGTFFKYTRSQEQAADQFALTVMRRAGISPVGLTKLLNKLIDQEALLVNRQDPYLRTHPLTRARLDHVEEDIRKRGAGPPTPPLLKRLHERMRAKLIGFLLGPTVVLERYEKNPKSVEARYASAVAYHRQHELDEALKQINSLIQEFPRDGFFYELKGQILFESSQIQGAVRAYDQAVKLLPNEPLIRVGLAQAQLQTGDRRLVDVALGHLIRAVRTEKNYPLAWRMMSVAYGRKGMLGESAWTLAEYFLLVGPRGDLIRSIKRAERLLKRGSPAWRRVQDIKLVVQASQRRRR